MIKKSKLMGLAYTFQNRALDARNVHNTTGDEAVFAISEGWEYSYTSAVGDLRDLIGMERDVTREDVRSCLIDWECTIDCWQRRMNETPYKVRKFVYQGKIEIMSTCIREIKKFLEENINE